MPASQYSALCVAYSDRNWRDEGYLVAVLLSVDTRQPRSLGSKVQRMVALGSDSTVQERVTFSPLITAVLCTREGSSRFSNCKPEVEGRGHQFIKSYQKGGGGGCRRGVHVEAFFVRKEGHEWEEGHVCKEGHEQEEGHVWEEGICGRRGMCRRRG